MLWHGQVDARIWRGERLSMVSGVLKYFEMYNALTDAMDELIIMKMLNHELSKYALAGYK